MSPTQGIYPAADVCAIGDQISSTYEGRHVTLYGDDISHGSQVSYVTKGYGVWFNQAVGMPFTTQTSALGNLLMTMDTEGIWCVDVYGYDDDGAVAVAPGDRLYINITTGLVSKINNIINQIPFGYALGNVTSNATERIAVKVHWDPSTWTDRDMYAVMISGRSADDAYKITVVDQTIETGGYSKGLLINYTQAGTKTGTATVECLGLEMAVTANCPTVVTGLEIYSAAIANKTIGRLTALEVYHENRGNAVASDYMFMLGRNSNAALTGPGADAWFYCREHSTVRAGSAIFMLQGNNAADYFITFGQPAGAEDSGVILEQCTDTSAATHRIQIRLGSDALDRWIRLYDD